MAWIRIDDHFDEHPKMQRVGPIAWGYWLAGLAYCNRNLTDGFIPWNKARTLCSFEVVEEDGQLWELSRVSGHSGEDITAQWLIGLLLEVGLWEEVRTDSGRIDGYMVHDYPDYQPLRAQVEADREANRKRVESHRKKNGQFGNGHGNDDVTPLHKHYNGVSNDEVTTAPNPNPNLKDEANASSRREMKSIEDLPRNGPAQTLVAEWYRRVGTIPASYRKVVGQAQSLVAAGVDVPELMLIYDYLAADPYWASGFDLGIALSQLDKIRQSRRSKRKSDYVSAG